MARQDYRISFGDLKVSERAKEYVKDALDTNYVSGGPRVREFEDGWGILFGHKYSVAMSNGTAANTAACMALYDFGATRGDEIIAPALAFAAVGNSIMQAGFEPAFVDIRRDTMNIDSDLIERRINNKTRAIIAVHTMGKPCDMERIMEIAKEYDLKVIEDCCEAYGGTYSGRYNGTIGDLSTSSFYVAHIISCGDGGMVSTSDPEIESVLRSIKDHGRRPGSMYFDHERHGANFRMNALTASVGLPEIDTFWQTFGKRVKNFRDLSEMTRDLEDRAYFVKSSKREGLAPHAFSLTLKDPSLDYGKFYDFLDKRGIECKRNFGSMPTQHGAFKHLGHKLGEFPEAEFVGDNGLHFGIHQFLSKDDMSYASEVIHEYFSKKIMI